MILYGCIPRFFGGIEMWWNLFDYAAIVFYSPFLDEGKEQRLVAARADPPYTQNTPDA